MQSIKFVMILLAASIDFTVYAQQPTTQEQVDIKSYALYEKGSWKELLQYGKASAKEGQDFLLLRLRMAYASFMLGNYSEAISQYDHVLKQDGENATAHYYKFLCRTYLSQSELAGAEIKYLSKEAIEELKLKKVAFTRAGTEVSYKITDYATRQNGLYAAVHAGLQLGWNVTMFQSVALFNQTISEPKFIYVTDNNNIAINQKQYYNRTTINLNNKWQVKLAYHYLHTPFNNYSYNNHVGLVGIKYTDAYYDVQADAIASRLTDTTRQQYDATLGLYPLGNLNLYFLSTGSLRTYNGSAFNLKQVVGFKVMKYTWLEFNGTFGKFTNLAENDALYIFNAVDRNTIKAGTTLYVNPSQHIILHAGYTFEQREIYKSSILFNQHSITGGLTWKM